MADARTEPKPRGRPRRDDSYVAVAYWWLSAVAACASVASLVVSVPEALTPVFVGVMAPAVVLGVIALLVIHGRGGLNLAAIWRAASSVRRRLALAIVVVLVLSVVIGGGFPAHVPGVRDGHYVALEHGGVVDVLAKAEYDKLRAEQFRAALAGGVLCVLLAVLWSTPRQTRYRLSPTRDLPRRGLH